jgi:predicted transcriptional regulator
VKRNDPTPETMSFASKLFAEQKRLGLTDQALASRLCCSQKKLWRLKKGTLELSSAEAHAYLFVLEHVKKSKNATARS